VCHANINKLIVKSKWEPVTIGSSIETFLTSPLVKENTQKVKLIALQQPMAFY